MSVSMVKVSNVDATDTDVDSLVRSTKFTFTIFLGAVWELILCAKKICSQIHLRAIREQLVLICLIYHSKE